MIIASTEIEDDHLVMLFSSKNENLNILFTALYPEGRLLINQ